MIDYKEFTSGIFNRPSSAVTPRGGAPQQATSANSMEEMMNRLRSKLASRGARGIIGLGRAFRIMDDNGSRTLDLYEFTKAMKDYMLGFNDTEIRSFYTYFDYDRSGSIGYDEFIRTIRGVMNAGRKKLV